MLFLDLLCVVWSSVGSMPFVDHFRNDVINRQEYYVIPDMLAKTLAEVLVL